MIRAAVMQPYFVPYLGYFRLIERVDVFVAFDCVQFPRRGWVHRNRLHDANETLAWLTLPIHRCPRETRIDDLVFDQEAQGWWQSAQRRFPALREPSAQSAISLVGLPREGGPVGDFLIEQLERMKDAFAIQTPIVRSSTFNLSADLRGTERVIEICRQVGATRYLNAPGGRNLYDPLDFRQAGVELDFLDDWHGSPASVLERLILEGAESLASDLRRLP